MSSEHSQLPTPAVGNGETEIRSTKLLTDCGIHPMRAAGIRHAFEITRETAHAALSGDPQPKRAYYETHEPPHCPTCGCGSAHETSECQSLCKHDWVGDDECPYCALEDFDPSDILCPECGERLWTKSHIHATGSPSKASEQRAPEGCCPVCGGQNGEHKPGCEPAPGDIV